MPSVVHNYDKINNTHPLGDVDVDHYEPVFLVPQGMVLGGRPGGGEPWQNNETTAHDCGDRHWSTVHDPHFGFPIGRRLAVAVYGGPIGDAYEGHVSGSIELWYRPLGDFELAAYQKRIPQFKA